MKQAAIYGIKEIKHRLEPVFKANGVRKAILFGSYARGEATVNSDIDIFVDSGLRGLDFVGLMEYIREALGKEVDLIEARYLAAGSPLEQEIA